MFHYLFFRIYAVIINFILQKSVNFLALYCYVFNPKKSNIYFHHGYRYNKQNILNIWSQRFLVNPSVPLGALCLTCSVDGVLTDRTVPGGTAATSTQQTDTLCVVQVRETLSIPTKDTNFLTMIQYDLFFNFQCQYIFIFHFRFSTIWSGKDQACI